LTVLFLGLIAEVDSVSIVAAMSSALLMVFSSYMGAVSIVASVKWFWFLFFLAFMAYVIYSLTRTFRQSVDASGQMCLVELYSRLTWIVVVTYSLYAIVWLFCQGFPSFSVTLEVVAYSLLDIINKVRFSQHTLFFVLTLACRMPLCCVLFIAQVVFTGIVVSSQDWLDFLKGGKVDNRAYC
jgi:bacteriorhodopsin